MRGVDLSDMLIGVYSITFGYKVIFEDFRKAFGSSDRKQLASVPK